MATQITGPYEVKAGSTEPIRATLRQGNKQPVDLTDVATVTYVVRLRGAHRPDCRCQMHHPAGLARHERRARGVRPCAR